MTQGRGAENRLAASSTGAPGEALLEFPGPDRGACGIYLLRVVFWLPGGGTFPGHVAAIFPNRKGSVGATGAFPGYSSASATDLHRLPFLEGNLASFELSVASPRAGQMSRRA